MNHWREDPEGMDRQIAKAMVALGYATKQEDEEKIVDRFNSDKFQQTEGFYKVANAAEDNHTETIMSGAGPVVEIN